MHERYKDTLVLHTRVLLTRQRGGGVAGASLSLPRCCGAQGPTWRSAASSSADVAPPADARRMCSTSAASCALCVGCAAVRSCAKARQGEAASAEAASSPAPHLQQRVQRRRAGSAARQAGARKRGNTCATHALPAAQLQRPRLPQHSTRRTLMDVRGERRAGGRDCRGSLQRPLSVRPLPSWGRRPHGRRTPRHSAISRRERQHMRQRDRRWRRRCVTAAQAFWTWRVAAAAALSCVRALTRARAGARHGGTADGRGCERACARCAAARRGAWRQAQACAAHTR